MKVWICVVRREAFVGGESQRCRHPRYGETELLGCGVMELIGGEPLEWCSTHASPQVRVSPTNCQMLIEPLEGEDDPCLFEPQIRVGP